MILSAEQRRKLAEKVYEKQQQSNSPNQMEQFHVKKNNVNKSQGDVYMDTSNMNGIMLKLIDVLTEIKDELSDIHYLLDRIDSNVSSIDSGVFSMGVDIVRIDSKVELMR